MSRKLSINRDSRAIAERVAGLKPFDTYGNMSATDNPYWGGRLGPFAMDLWDRDSREPDTYAVYSYGTPILWHTAARGWVAVRTRFSISTSKHQGRAFYGLTLSDDKRVQDVPAWPHLSEAQWALLRDIRYNGPRTVKGQGHRTAAVLLRLGLVESGRFGRLSLSHYAARELGVTR